MCVIASFEEAVRHGLAKIVWITTGKRAITLREYSWTRTAEVPLDPKSCKLLVAEHIAGRVDHVGTRSSGQKFVAVAGRSVEYDALVFALEPTADMLDNEFYALYGSPLPIPDRLANRSSATFNIYSPFSMRELAGFVSDIKSREYLRASVGETPAPTVQDDSDEEADDDDVELPRPVCIDLALPPTWSKLCERLCATSKVNDPKLLHFAAHDTERSLELQGKNCDDSEVVRVFAALSDTYLHTDATSATFLRDVKSIRISGASARDVSPLALTMFSTAAGIPVSSWLRALTIEDTLLDLQQVETLCNSFSDISRVESLALRGIGMHQECAPMVAVALKRLRHCLRSVDIGMNDIGPVGVSVVLQALPVASLVRSLGLSSVGATDSNVKLIIASVPHLESCNLSSNVLGDEFALHLGECLRSGVCKRLRSMNIEHNAGISIAGLSFLLKCCVASLDSTPISALLVKGCAAVGVHEAPFAGSFLAHKRTESFSASIIESEAKSLEVLLAAANRLNLAHVDLDIVQPSVPPPNRFDPAQRQPPRKEPQASVQETLDQIAEVVRKNCTAAATRMVPHAVAARAKPLHLLDAAAAAAAAIARPDASCVVLRIIDRQEEVFGSQENFFEHEQYRAALFEKLVADVDCPNVIFRCGSKGRQTIERLRHFCDATVTALQPCAPSVVKRIATQPFIYDLPQVDDRYYLNEKMSAFMIGPGCSAKHTDVMSVYSAVSGSLSFFAMHLMPHLVTEVLRKLLCPQLKSLGPLLTPPEKLRVLLHHDFRLAREQLATSLTTNVASEEELRRYAQSHGLAEMLNTVLERVQALAPATYEDVMQAQRRYAVSVVEATHNAKPVEPTVSKGGEKKKKDEASTGAAAAPVAATGIASAPPDVPAVDSWSAIAQVLQEHCVPCS